MGKFSVKALAEELKVPRTTVNDWLNRYEQYIECSLQGKRRVYSVNSLNVLREISELRAKGLSSFEIEEALATRHPVQGVVANEKQEQKDGEVAVAQSTPPADYASVVKLQVEEMGHIISEYVQNVTTRLDELEEQNSALINYSEESKNSIIAAAREEALGLQLLFNEQMKGMQSKIESLEEENKALLRKRGNIGIWGVLLFVAFIVIGGALFFVYQMDKKIAKKEALLSKVSGHLEETKGAFTVTKKVLEEKESKLEKLSKEREKLANKNTVLLTDVKTLKRELKSHEDAFNRLQKKIKESTDSKLKKEAELLKLRNEFAKERLMFLKQLEALSKQAKEREQALRELEKKRLAEQRKLKEVLQKQDKKLEDIHKVLDNKLHQEPKPSNVMRETGEL